MNHRLHGGAQWRHLVNTNEPSMCGDDAAFLSNYFDHLLYFTFHHITLTILDTKCIIVMNCTTAKIDKKLSTNCLKTATSAEQLMRFVRQPRHLVHLLQLSCHEMDTNNTP